MSIVQRNLQYLLATIASKLTDLRFDSTHRLLEHDYQLSKAGVEEYIISGHSQEPRDVLAVINVIYCAFSAQFNILPHIRNV